MYGSKASYTGGDKKKQAIIEVNQAHEQYGHVSEAAMCTTLRSIGIHPSGKLQACEGCALSKAQAKSMSKLSTVQATTPGEQIFLDMSGPYTSSIVGSKCWIMFVDDYS